MDAPLLRRVNRQLRPFGLSLATVPVWLGGLFIALLWGAPFVWMVSTSLKLPGEVMTVDIEWLPRHVTLENYRRIFAEFPLLRWGFNSIVVAGASTALSVLTGAMAGYALARMRFPGRGFLFGLFVASLMVPTEVSVVPLLLGMIKIGWANTYQALILPSVANVFSVYIFRQFFLKFPADLEDAARMDGAGHFLIFWRIGLPLARAPLIAATVILFTLNWNSFLWPLLVTFDESMKTLPVGIAAFAPEIGTHTQLEGFALGMAGITVLSLPSLLLFFALQRYFIQGIASGALRG
ncbi:MAG TPA: carbohydrate ABC transporter permease [Dongiaceae bacterium]|nr:carbohydrate ABC transporter permease [Dongiaceae bacterium]